ncbi:MAG: DUF4143 domain-containing protein [Candidatus Brocadiales bacterium]|nr:DUF4143 domain-containing protein [Candidatus Brocadiales bacterium]MBL7005595.1 DUF4143 domain-containing protein [Spirochaetia bacterium]
MNFYTATKIVIGDALLKLTCFITSKVFAKNNFNVFCKTTILKDCTQNYESLHINTLDSYLSALNKLFVIDDLPAWSPKLRSKTTIRISDTHHFIDPAIAAYFLQTSPRDLLYDPNTLGLLFESLAIRDLRIYSQALRGKLSHYRDKSGVEADAIMHLSDGRWAAIEVKLGSRQVDEAAKNLLALKERIDTTHINSPSFLMIITGTEFAYQRKDGVLVVPLGCLRP